jgi:hypothetical protein
LTLSLFYILIFQFNTRLLQIIRLIIVLNHIMIPSIINNKIDNLFIFLKINYKDFLNNSTTKFEDVFK